MTPERLRRIETIFHSACDLKPTARSRFLEEACCADEELRREIEALLSSSEQAGGFIAEPILKWNQGLGATDIAAEVLAQEQATFAVGRTLGHYQLLEPLGSGGMGEVYLAADDRSGRKAALKLLPLRFTGDAERFNRFQQEARTVIALNHPNILTIYEIGEEDSTHYIASELIEGETLRRRLLRQRVELDLAIDVAIQVASALAAAHEAGIVHRDIKPENIMLRRDGYVKVLDFGIAKLAEQELPRNIATEEALLMVATNLGSILGTARYMAPEQARGDAVDKRADIWSLGVVLYEMVTGCTPFYGETPEEVIAAIVKAEPTPVSEHKPEVPAELEQIISKALRKDRAQRYGSATEMMEALKNLRRKLEFAVEVKRTAAALPWWRRWMQSPRFALVAVLIAALAVSLSVFWPRTTAVEPQKRAGIAVLPFQNLSEDKANAYFADGMQDEIITRLANIGELRVISRSSTQRYKSRSENLIEVARQLGVAHFVEGSVQKAGDRVRINVQLIRAGTNDHLWAQIYDRNLTDIFAVQSEVAMAIASSLEANLSGREQKAVAQKPTSNLDAYDAYLRGLEFFNRPGMTFENLTAAVDMFEEAVRLDPIFALAWARLSATHAAIYFHPWDASPARIEAARVAVETATKLQPDAPDTLMANAYYRYRAHRDYEGARVLFEKVRQQVPSDSEARQALAFVARRQGRWSDALKLFEEAARLNPRDAQLLNEWSWTLSMVRQIPAAIQIADRGLAVLPDDPSLLATKVSLYQNAGNLPAAASVLAKLDPTSSHSWTIASWTSQFLLERRYADAIEYLRKSLSAVGSNKDYTVSLCRLGLAEAQEMAGDKVAARATYLEARDELEAFQREQPENVYIVSGLAAVHAGLGNKEAALRENERALAMPGATEDPLAGPLVEESCARTEVWLGEADRAIARLERLLTTPYMAYPITQAVLRLDPCFDPLRSHPRFKALVEGPEPKTIYK